MGRDASRRPRGAAVNNDGRFDTHGHPRPGVPRMKAYVMTTGAAFALLVLIHAWRLVVEGVQILADPFYWISTLMAAGLSLWASRLLWLSRTR